MWIIETGNVMDVSFHIKCWNQLGGIKIVTFYWYLIWTKIVKIIQVMSNGPWYLIFDLNWKLHIFHIKSKFQTVEVILY